jgi:formyltetrahydrofolate synthetase
METTTIKNYEVTLLLLINPSKNDELKRVEHIVSATSENEARKIAKEIWNDGLSIYESWANEI